MLMMRQEFSLAVKDLRYVGITCKNCKTDVVLDMESESTLAKAVARVSLLLVPHLFHSG